MAVIIYNPKTFSGKQSVPVNFLWEKMNYKLGVNELKKFPDIVGSEMLKRYGFLEEVKPETLENIKKRMTDKQFVCEHCHEEFLTEQQLRGHMLGKHKLSKENEELLKSIPDAETAETAFSRVEGVPASGKTDRQGVEWYGAGLEKDSLSDMKPAKGTF